jgi:FMN-dependent oxidoreductase (nitrilotriacetate monooxygenase family)
MASQLILNAFVSLPGHHTAAWRHSTSSCRQSRDLGVFAGIAHSAERGRLHSLFVADSVGGGQEVGGWNAGVEPITLLSALAGITRHIGLIGTASTTFSEPYNLARTFASLDHLSRGRAGWNIVTTSNTAAPENFGGNALDHAQRYVRAAEFVEVVTALWDSMEDDAEVFDQASGRRYDLSKVHTIDHVGPAFRVRGPLNAARSPQGWPILVQAGSSADGMDFAARFAEAIFTAQLTLEDAQSFYADIKSRVAAVGRDPAGVKVLPGLCAYLGSTEEEAARARSELDDLAVPPTGPIGEALLQFGGLDLTGFAPDEPIPFHLLPEESQVQGPRSRFALILEIARRENLTVRDLLRRLAGARGHFTFVGTPDQLADLIEAWFTQRAADGFNLMPPIYAGQFDMFVDEVVPILQRRGVFHTDYEGATLRDNYGLARPASRFSASSLQVSTLATTASPL